MMARRLHRSLIAVALASVALAGAADALTGGCAGLAHLLPLALLVVPVLAGRYLGEERLARMAGRRVPAPRRRPAHTCAKRSHPRTVPRGTRGPPTRRMLRAS